MKKCSVFHWFLFIDSCFPFFSTIRGKAIRCNCNPRLEAKLKIKSSNSSSAPFGIFALAANNSSESTTAVSSSTPSTSWAEVAFLSVQPNSVKKLTDTQAITTNTTHFFISLLSNLRKSTHLFSNFACFCHKNITFAPVFLKIGDYDT